MTTLHSLSNELLVHVFSSCPTIQSAMSLSKVDKTLHSIWHMHNNQIAESVLRQQIPDYEDAVDLAILEQVWTNDNTQLATPPFSKVTTQLLHNAEIAADATDAWVWTANRDDVFPPEILSPFLHKSTYAAYYHMPKIVLSYLYPEARLQNSICATLRLYPEEDHNGLYIFYVTLGRKDAKLRDRGKHGIDKPWSEWKQYEWQMWEESKSPLTIVSDPWKYVDTVLDALVEDDSVDGNMLEMVLGVRAT